MRDVMRASGHRFDRRPPEPVPREVERADRHAPIDDNRAIEVGRPLEAVLPRAREDRQLQRRVATREQRLDELMGVLADAAAFAQRGAIVNHDAHLFKSFRVSILL